MEAEKKEKEVLVEESEASEDEEVTWRDGKRELARAELMLFLRQANGGGKKTLGEGSRLLREPLQEGSGGDRHAGEGEGNLEEEAGGAGESGGEQQERSGSDSGKAPSDEDQHQLSGKLLEEMEEEIDEAMLEEVERLEEEEKRKKTPNAPQKGEGKRESFETPCRKKRKLEEEEEEEGIQPTAPVETVEEQMKAFEEGVKAIFEDPNERGYYEATLKQILFSKRTGRSADFEGAPEGAIKRAKKEVSTLIAFHNEKFNRTRAKTKAVIKDFAELNRYLNEELFMLENLLS